MNNNLNSSIEQSTASRRLSNRELRISRISLLRKESHILVCFWKIIHPKIKPPNTFVLRNSHFSVSFCFSKIFSAMAADQKVGKMCVGHFCLISKKSLLFCLISKKSLLFCLLSKKSLIFCLLSKFRKQFDSPETNWTLFQIYQAMFKLSKSS